VTLKCDLFVDLRKLAFRSHFRVLENQTFIFIGISRVSEHSKHTVGQRLHQVKVLSPGSYSSTLTSFYTVLYYSAFYNIIWDSILIVKKLISDFDDAPP
jgi:hypothetical protein